MGGSPLVFRGRHSLDRLLHQRGEAAAEFDIAHSWFLIPNIVYLSPVPILTFLVAIREWRASNARPELGHFAGAIMLFLLCYIGHRDQPMAEDRPVFTLRKAASSPDTQVSH